MMSLRRISYLAGLAPMLVAQQSISPDELRFRTTNYWPRSQTVLSAETRLVEIGVVVRDGTGHTVGGLVQGNFDILDAGKHREITVFAAENRRTSAATLVMPKPASTPGAPSGVPVATRGPLRYLGLVFDDLHMGVADLGPVQAAAHRFLKEALQPDDRLGVFLLSRGLVVPFTSDTQKVSDAIDRLSSQIRVPVPPTCPSLTAYEAFLIADHRDLGYTGRPDDPSLLKIKVDEAANCGFCSGGGNRLDPNCAIAVSQLAHHVWEEVRAKADLALRSLAYTVDVMGAMPGKRALVYASSGFLSRTLEQELDALIPRALHAGVVVNSLDTKGLYTEQGPSPSGGLRPVAPTPRSHEFRQAVGSAAQWDSNDTMAVLSTATGGLFFHDNNDLELGFRELGLVPEHSYVLGFTPSEAPDNRYHVLKVRLKSAAHYQLQARPGYFAASSLSTRPAPERPVDRELMSHATRTGVPGQITATSTAMLGGDTGLRVTLHLEPPRLPFTASQGVRRLQLIFVAALFDKDNVFVTGKETDGTFALKEETYNRIKEGLDLTMTLLAPQGNYRLGAVIGDGSGDNLTTWSQPAEIQSATTPPAK